MPPWSFFRKQYMLIVSRIGGSINLMLQNIYGDAYTSSKAQQNIGSIQFVGIVVGQLFFGYTSDHYSRKWSLLASTVVLLVFNILTTGAYGAGGSVSGLFAALAAYRFLTGMSPQSLESHAIADVI